MAYIWLATFVIGWSICTLGLHWNALWANIPVGISNIISDHWQYPLMPVIRVVQGGCERVYWSLHPSIHHANALLLNTLTHWGRVTHICVGNLTIIGQDNGLSPGLRQAIIWTNAGILLIGPWWTNFSEISIGIHTFSFKKIHLKMSSAKWRPFCLGLDVLTHLPLVPHRSGMRVFSFLTDFHFLGSPKTIFIIEQTAPKCSKWVYLFHNFPGGIPLQDIFSIFHRNPLPCLIDESVARVSIGSDNGLSLRYCQLDP